MFLKRMLYASAAILMLAPAYHLGARFASASTIIYSTFNPGDTYDVTSGWTIGGTPVLVQALQFTPTESGMVQTIEIAAFRIAGGTAVNVSVTTDAGDQPGSVLETVPVCCFGGISSIQLANSVLHPELSAGTKYWLVVSPVAAGDYFGWNRLLDPPYALNAQQSMGGPWSVGLEYRGTVRIRAVSALEAAVDLDPNVINLKNHAPWLTAYIEPAGFDLTSIDISSVRLAGAVPADPKFARVGDHDANGAQDLMVKFSREALDPLLTLGVNDLEVTGSLVTGQQFKGSDEVSVIHPPEVHVKAAVTPNPLNPVGVLIFRTTRSGPVSIKLFDIHGGLVKTVVESQPLDGGRHEVQIDGRGEGGRPLASGVYFFRIEAPGESEVGRIAILK